MNSTYTRSTTASRFVNQVAATIELPPGSTSADLQAAIDAANSGDIIVLSSDMDFSSVVTIPSGLAVTIESTAGDNWEMAQTAPGFRHFDVLGSLIINRVTLDGHTPENPGGVTRGGVQVQADGTFDMRAGAIIRNCYASSGGGVNVSGGTMIMESGSIANNRAEAGGGINIATNGVLRISGGTVSGNASTYGGGIYLTLESVGTMTGGMIGGSSAADANQASSYGGGVAVYNSSSFLLDGGIIEGNRVVTDAGGNGGGGVYVINNSTFELRDGAIRNNFVSAGANYPSFGGGVMLGELTFVVPPGLAPASTLFMSGGSIDGNETSYRGGGVAAVANCNVAMTGGTISGNTANTLPNGGGGGVFIGTVLESSGVTFTMDGGEITENTGNMGGGVLVFGSQSNPSYAARFLMNSGSVTNNQGAVANGGGVCVLNLSGALIMGEPEAGLPAPIISGNRANSNGGGVYTTTTCIANGAMISGNTAENGSGGGVYVAASGTMNVSGASFITENSAPNGNGGGIFTENFDYGDPANTAAYANIATAEDTVFSGNSAIAAYVPPVNASSFANIGYAQTSIHTSDGYLHPLNNYDINYAGATELALYTVTYDPNGGIGGHIITNVAGGSMHSVLSAQQAGIFRSGYTFTGWNTAVNGTGTAYNPGNIIEITEDVILYAQWEANEKPVCKPKGCPPCCTRCGSCCKRKGNLYYVMSPRLTGKCKCCVPLLPI